jgi:two-component system cell cycle response regulator
MPGSAPVPVPVGVALLGFSNFERTALSACFRLAGERVPLYEQVIDPAQAELLVADGEHAPSLQLVQITERLADTVFIGAQPPEGARAWMARPIDPLHVMRELDAMVSQRAAAQAAAALQPAVGPVSEPAPVLVAAAAESAPGPEAGPLPGAPLDSPASPPPGPAPDLPSAPRRGRRTAPEATRVHHALLVDDSAIAALFLQKCLQPFGLQITTAAHSSRATLLLSQQRFDFIFLDVELGDDSPMDGLTLCQQIRRRPVPAGEQPPVVVMVTAHHRELDRVRGTLAGCDAYLAKPVKQAELDQLMRRHGVEPAPLPAAPAG